MVMSCGEDLISYLINKYANFKSDKSIIDIDQEVNKVICNLFHDLIVCSEKVRINNMVK